jgi:Cdc6-like AAA superfamily ATPase
MRPNSFDTKLFANREEEYTRIKGKIGMFLDNRDEERRKFMIYGERGVGKSILIRKIIKDISEERDIISITIDGDEARNPEDLLRDICKNLAGELSDFYTKNMDKNDTIEKEIAFLDYISYVDELKDSDVTTIVERLEGNIESGIGIFNVLTLRSKIGAVEGKNHAISHEIKQSIDSMKIPT